MRTESASAPTFHRVPRGRFTRLAALGLWPVSSLAAGLGFLKDTPILYLTEADRTLQTEAALYVLQHPTPDAVREWHNPDTGFNGRVAGLGDWIAPEGQRCRKIRLVTHARGAESMFVLPLCKDAAGEWFIGSGLELRPSKGGDHVAAEATLVR